MNAPIPPPTITVKKLTRKRGRPRKPKAEIRVNTGEGGGSGDGNAANQEGFYLNSVDPEIRHTAEKNLNLTAHLANISKPLASQEFIDRKFQHRIYNLSHANSEWQQPNQTKLILT